MTQSLDTSRPLVSVVSPFYKAGDFVEETVKSVLAQDYPNIEHILIDDASPDSSGQVLRDLAERYPSRVRALLLEQNRGGSHARNLGAREAEGQYVMFLDADDTIEPDTISHLVATLQSNPGKIAYCDWRRLYLQGEGWVPGEREIRLPAEEEDHLHCWLTGIWIPTCSTLWPRELLEEVGGWDETLRGNDDGEMMMRTLAKGVRLVRSAGGMGNYRRYGLSLSSRSLFSEVLFCDFVRSLEQVEALLHQLGLFEKYRQDVGIAYSRLPLHGFLRTHPHIVFPCLEKSVSYSGSVGTLGSLQGSTMVGRLLSRFIGLEQKEKIALYLARHGLMTQRRKDFLERKLRVEEEYQEPARIEVATPTFAR